MPFRSRLNMLFQPEEVPEDTVGRMDQVLGYKQLHTSLEPLQAQMQENALLAKQIALCVQDKQRLQQELAAAKHALDTARRELERQRSSDAGVFAAKVKAEEALRIAVRGEDEEWHGVVRCATALLDSPLAGNSACASYTCETAETVR